MARVPLLDGDEDPSMAELAEKIRSGRRGNVINVYKLLLHSPPVAENWFNLINTLRWGTELPGRLREIVIIRIGYLNRVDYVINQHVPKLALAESSWSLFPNFCARRVGSGIAVLQVLEER